MGRSPKIVPEICPPKELKLLEKTGVKLQSHFMFALLQQDFSCCPGIS
jgi:hypothetical protein